MTSTSLPAQRLRFDSLAVDAVVLADDARAFSGHALLGRVRAVAAVLAARDLRRGDRLGLVVRSSADAVVVLLACLRRGVVVVPINPGYQREERDHVVGDSGAAAVYDEDDCRALVEAASEDAVGDGAADDDGDDDDPALLIYTSGTTGKSKGCIHTARSLVGGLSPLMTLWGVGADDVVVNALPLFHVHGLCVALLGPLLAGARVRLVPHFTPEHVVAAVSAGGTVFMSVPTMVHRLSAFLDEVPAAASTLARLRLMTCGSAALSAHQLARFREQTGLTLLERYGMSETLITLSNPLVGERRPGAVGLPVPDTQIRVVDDELQVSTPGIMKGYWNRPDADREVLTDDGWFKTGDVVTVDADAGYVRIVGRASQDILKVGGFKLSAREIEEQLERHPAVQEVAVVGVPDDEWGERVVAVVVVRAGQTLTLEQAQAATQLTQAKKPRALVVVDALPRNGMGKVMKPAVKELVRLRLIGA